jgi:hypothetical protein
MVGTGFHSIAKLRAQIRNAVLADRGVYSADCHNENGRTADCQSQEYTFESGCYRPNPSAGFILGLRAGVGNPQYDGELIAKQLFLLWQFAELERGV